MCFSILSLNSTRIVYSTLQNVCRIDNVLFSECKISSNEHGGAICFNNVTTSLDIVFTTFYSCQTTYVNCNGGAIFYLSFSKHLRIESSCFSCCLSEYRGPCIYSNAKNGNFFVNVAVHKCPDGFLLNSQYPLQIRDGFISMDKINVSNNYPKYYSAGLLIHIGTGFNLGFSAIANCRAGESCVIDIQNFIGDQNGFSINVVNNSFQFSTHGILYSYNSNPVLSFCVFSQNYEPLFRGEGNITLNNCAFDKYTYTLKAPILNNCILSSINVSTNSLSLIKYLTCQRLPVSLTLLSRIDYMKSFLGLFAFLMCESYN